MRYTEIAIHLDARDGERALLALLDEGLAVEERDASTLLRPPPGKALFVLYCEPHETAQRLELLSALMGREAILVELTHAERDEDDWRDAWKAHFRPRPVGPFVIVPSWETYAAKEGERIIRLDPGRAFGTGGHASTRLCLDLIGRHMRGALRFLDVGCGSGMLAIGCALLSPSARGVAIDVDPDAVEVTRENAADNGVAERIAASTTPLDALPVAADADPSRDGRFDLIVANIQLEVLSMLASHFPPRLAPEGELIVSGLLKEQGPPMIAIMAGVGLAVVDRSDEDGWCALVLRHASAPPATVPA